MHKQERVKKTVSNETVAEEFFHMENANDQNGFLMLSRKERIFLEMFVSEKCKGKVLYIASNLALVGHAVIHICGYKSA